MNTRSRYIGHPSKCELQPPNAIRNARLFFFLFFFFQSSISDAPPFQLVCLIHDPSWPPHGPESVRSPRRIAPLTSSLHPRLRFTLSDTPSRGKITLKLGATYRGGAGRGLTLTCRCVLTVGSKSNRDDFVFTYIAITAASLPHLHIFPSSADLAEHFSRKTAQSFNRSTAFPDGQSPTGHVRIIRVKLGVELSLNSFLLLVLCLFFPLLWPPAELLSRCFFFRFGLTANVRGKRSLSPELLWLEIEISEEPSRTQYSPAARPF